MCPQELADRFASPEFRTFRCRRELLDSEYFGVIAGTAWFWRKLAHLKRSLGARRERARPEHFLAIRLEMPELSAQERALPMFRRVQAFHAINAGLASYLVAFPSAMLARAFYQWEAPVHQPSWYKPNPGL